MRKPWGVTALIAGLALLFSAGAMPAYADPGNNGNGNGNGNANGNNGNGNNGNNGNNANANAGGNGGSSNAGGNGGSANAGGSGSGNGGTGSQAGDPAGANGTVKIHDWPEHKNGSEMANDPKVCQFEIHGFNFDGGQAGRWWIQEHKWGNGDASKADLSGAYTANGSGDWTSGPHRLDDGHYKLFVEMTHSAGNSGNMVTTYKMKVFKVECPVSGDTTTGGTTDTTTGGTTDTTTGGTTDTTTGGTTGGSQSGGSTETTATTDTTTVAGVSTSPTAVAGFESMPAGGLDHMQPGALAGSQSAAVAGSQSAPAELAAIGSLPSTSTAPDAPLGLIGLVITSLGAALLRRTERHN